jgi:hypothetical protein
MRHPTTYPWAGTQTVRSAGRGNRSDQCAGIQESGARQPSHSIHFLHFGELWAGNVARRGGLFEIAVNTNLQSSP